MLRSALNRPRPDLPDGCNEKLDRELLAFLRYVWNLDRDSRPGTEKMRLTVGPQVKTVRLQNRRQIEAFLDRFPASSDGWLRENDLGC